MRELVRVKIISIQSYSVLWDSKYFLLYVEDANAIFYFGEKTLDRRKKERVNLWHANLCDCVAVYNFAVKHIQPLDSCYL